MELFKIKKEEKERKPTYEALTLEDGKPPADGEQRDASLALSSLGFFCFASFLPLKRYSWSGCLSVLVLVAILAWRYALLCIMCGLLPAHKSVGKKLNFEARVLCSLPTDCRRHVLHGHQ